MADSNPMTDGNGLSVKLAKAMSAVEDGRLALLDYLEPYGLDDRVINRLEVVQEELLSNIVRHADKARHIQLSAYPCPEGICLCIEDDGAPFDPFSAQKNGSSDDLDDDPLGGLGIPLIKRLSHSVEYERVGSTNRVRLVIAT